jgi:hypothetical protein
MLTGAPLPAEPGSMNAYLGARPVAAALGAGADVVTTGRGVDAAVVLGPLMHEFGWTDDEYDLLAEGSLVGHLVECGPQVTGGNTTGWADIPGWDKMAYPIAEVRADGCAVNTKPRNTGGRLTPFTVGEQMLDEIGDPGAYLMPDVVCDWRTVTLTQEGEDRVLARGGPRQRSDHDLQGHRDQRRGFSRSPRRCSPASEPRARPGAWPRR